MRTNYFISFFFLILFLSNYDKIICENIDIKDSLNKNRKLVFNNYFQTYQTIRIFKKEDFSKVDGLKLFNFYIGDLFSLNIYNTFENKPKPILFPSSLKNIELVGGYLINPQVYGGSKSEKSMLKYKFLFGCVPVLLKFNFTTQKQKQYFVNIGLEVYTPIYFKKINDYYNLNRFYYKSEKKLGSIHFETGCQKHLSKNFNINIGILCQIYPPVYSMYSYGINYFTVLPLNVFIGSSINIFYNVK